MYKTDDISQIGMHCFERAGLGKTPFRCIGFTVSKHSDGPGCPMRPGSTCDYCGTGIMYVCLIRSSDGKTFKVGSDCVGKTGDTGLIKAYKSTPAYRAHQKELRDAKDERNREAIDRILSDETSRDILRASTFASHFADGKPRTDNTLAAAERWLPWCGAKGRAAWLAAFRKILKAEE